MAVDRLADGFTGDPAEDALIYPVLAMFRHHLELELKGVIPLCPAYLSGLDETHVQGVRDRLKKIHSLEELWKILRRLHPKCNYRVGAEGRRALQTVLFELLKPTPTRKPDDTR